jgi:hypothetical protein
MAVTGRECADARQAESCGRRRTLRDPQPPRRMRGRGVVGAISAAVPPRYGARYPCQCGAQQATPHDALSAARIIGRFEGSPGGVTPQLESPGEPAFGWASRTAPQSRARAASDASGRECPTRCITVSTGAPFHRGAELAQGPVASTGAAAPVVFTLPSVAVGRGCLDLRAAARWRRRCRGGRFRHRR